MRIMKPIHLDEIPVGDEWLYEMKYDGYRAILSISEDEISLKSRNNIDLTEKFPEIITACNDLLTTWKKFLPLQLDGELVILNNRLQANFSEIQKRGKMRNKSRIKEAALARPASFVTFDLLELKGKSYVEDKLIHRKTVLNQVFKGTEHERIWPLDVFHSKEEAERIVFEYKGEGIVAKKKESPYLHGKKHRDWFKIKNWRRIYVFLTAFHSENDYFSVAVYEGKNLRSIGKCKHGLDSETFTTLKQFFIENGKKAGNMYTMRPAVCAAIHTLDLYEGELREPEFFAIMPGMKPEECTLEKLKLDLSMLPPSIDLTNTEKALWKEPGYRKGDLLEYAREISPYMLPFLKNRLLTVIRAPDGVDKEQFYQKHLPSYAPEFVTGMKIGDEVFCSCDHLESLVWFANHGAIEYHVPFQSAGSVVPLEIVFDLDPPDREHFQLAVQAAQLAKIMLDELSLTSFVKTSGNKGLQIHIPIREGSMTYEETAVFTQAIAFTIEKSYPDFFTTERMKQKRGGRLYIDYVQHGKDKTIIAPYSPRKTAEGTVATPLFWHEVNESLDPVQFTIGNVVKRVKALGCPFAGYFRAGERQNMDKMLRLVRSGT